MLVVGADDGGEDCAVEGQVAVGAAEAREGAAAPYGPAHRVRVRYGTRGVRARVGAGAVCRHGPGRHGHDEGVAGQQLLELNGARLAGGAAGLQLLLHRLLPRFPVRVRVAARGRAQPAAGDGRRRLSAGDVQPFPQRVQHMAGGSAPEARQPRPRQRVGVLDRTGCRRVLDQEPNALLSVKARVSSPSSWASSSTATVCSVSPTANVIVRAATV